MARVKPCLSVAAVVAVFLAVLLTACQSAPPDRSADVARLAQMIREIPGVRAVNSEVSNQPARGLVYFTLQVKTSPDITANQLAAVTTRYLQALRMVDYTGYRSELVAQDGWSRFAIDRGALPVTNGQQIITQARAWVALRRQFPAAVIRLRATIVHPNGQLPVREWGHSGIGSVRLDDASNYADVATAVTLLTDRFPELTTLAWTVSSGAQHPAAITTSGRFPTPQELQVWRQVNSDQSIAHVDKMTINGRVTAPVWFAEETRSHDPAAAAALALAQHHLPLMRGLPAPVLYTSSDQIQGHITGDGRSTGPIAITVGGCTDRDLLTYQPPPIERELMNVYETCGHP